MSIKEAIENLDIQRNNLAQNLTIKGVAASNSETLASLVPKVLEIRLEEKDLSDASASKEDILFGKTAYTGEGKITGTHYCQEGSLFRKYALQRVKKFNLISNTPYLFV